MTQLETHVDRPAPAPGYLRLPAVIARYGCSRATIYAWIAQGAFPAPVKLGPRLAAWRSEELALWESTRGPKPRPGEPTRFSRPTS